MGKTKTLEVSEVRKTLIVQPDKLKKIKEIAYWERNLFKDQVNMVFEKFIEDYEKDNGRIHPIPSKKSPEQ